MLRGLFFMEKDGAHQLMMVSWVVFGEVVSEVKFAFLPMNVELALAYAVADPIEAHIDCLGSTLLHFVIDDSKADFVVGLNRGGWLGVSKFMQGLADGTRVLAVLKGCANFCFGG